MASTTWQIRGLDTLGNDLVLSRLVAWGSSGEVIPATITSTFTPDSGTLANLLVDDSTQCVFTAADVQKPGFAIEFTFATPVDLRGFRFAGPSGATWPVGHAVATPPLVVYLPPVPFPGAGLLSVAPTQALQPGVPLNEWSAQTAAGSREWVRCAVSADGRVLMATAYTNGNIWLSKDGGATWVAQTAAGARNWYGCGVSGDGQVLLASAYGGNLWLSKDGGATWVAQTAAGSRNWSGCAVSVDGLVLIAAAYTNGNLWLSKDGGATWVAQAAAGLRNWYGCAVSADGRVLLGSGAGATLWLSKDSGTTWAAQTAAGSRDWYECAMSADGQVLLATAYGSEHLWLSKDEGATWVAQTAAGLRNWQGCGVSGDGRVLLAGDYAGGSLWLSRDGGATWVSQPGAGLRNWYECAASNDGKVLLACVQNGNLHLRVNADPIYADPPLQQKNTKAAPWLTGPVDAQELGPITRTETPMVRDTEFGGNGRIYGTVERKNTPANVPMRRRVRLHRSRDGLLVRETWSNADGTYEFNGINMQYEYDTIAWDNEMSYRSVVANNLKPEAM